MENSFAPARMLEKNEEGTKNGETDETYGKGVKCEYGMAILFIAILISLICDFIFRIYPHVSEMFDNGNIYLIACVTALPWPFVFFIVFQMVDPGTISRLNVTEYVQKYPYDYQLYRPGVCSTEGITRVARSKYCRVLRKRIAYV